MELKKKQHILRHRDDSPRVCTLCCKHFTKPPDFDQHLRFFFQWFFSFSRFFSHVFSIKQTLQMNHKKWLARFFRWKDYDQIREAFWGFSPLEVWRRQLIWFAQILKAVTLPPLIMEDHGSEKWDVSNSTYLSNTAIFHWTMGDSNISHLCEKEKNLQECRFVRRMFVSLQGVVETPVRCSQDGFRKKSVSPQN